MTNSKRKPLILLRRVLSVLAVLLLCLTAFSGYMYFAPGTPVPETPAETTVSTLPPTEPELTLPPETTEAATEADTEASTAATEESALPDEIGKSDVEAPDDGPDDKTDATVPSKSSSYTALSSNQEIQGSPDMAPIPPETSAAMESAKPKSEVPEATGAPIPWGLIFWCSAGLLVLDLIGILLLSIKIKRIRKKKAPEMPQPVKPRTLLSTPIPSKRSLTIGTLHQPGRRQYQQDSLGHSIVLNGKGVLAVLADGMGGLKDGDKVSQQLVLRMLELGASLQENQANGALYQMLNQVNEEINQMLTPEGLYKCGSTIVSVLVQGKRFQWISVGDSRIYLYRAGYVNRLNRDHDLLQDWMPEILNGQRSLEASLADPNARKLTSFIGMGKLKYVDCSVRPIDILPGDRIILMSDGVYGEVSESQMAAIFSQYPDVRQAATALERQVRANQNPHQDNYTALILGF